MTVILFIIGLISILGQVVLLRELNVASFGVELVYILALGFWLAATALGALSCRSSRAPRPGLLTIPLLLFAALLPLAVAFARGSRVFAGGVPGAYLPFGEQIVTIGITLLPAGFITGWLFRRAAGFFVSEGRTLAAAYAIESAGGIAGGLLSSLGLHWGVQNFVLALTGALIAAAAPLLIAAGARQSQSRLPAVTLCAILLLCLTQAPALDGMMTRWNHPSLLESRDTPYGRISITEREAQVSVFMNNALAFETEGTEAEHFAHLAALQHPRPERILILGGGIEGTVAEVLKHGPVAVDYVEVDPAMIGTVREHLSPQRQEPLGRPGVRIITDDPRRFLQAEGRYDLILIGMPEPASGQANRFYTLEFFKLCRDRLKPEGIVALKIQAAENRWTPQMTERALSIRGALFSVYGNVLIIPGETDVVTASPVSLPSDPQVLIERLRSRGIRSRLISEPFIRYLLTNDRFTEVGETVRTRTAPLNTDRRPICYQLTALLWLSKFYPALIGLSLGEIESLMIEKWIWIAAAAGMPLILFFIARMRPSWRGTLLVGVAGFAGMVLETVLILSLIHI
jgi:spermidine synthase